jgi:hypothetical protein
VLYVTFMYSFSCKFLSMVGLRVGISMYLRCLYKMQEVEYHLNVIESV